MSQTIGIYDCGCLDGPEEFEPCRKARRLEDRMHDALLALECCYSSASDLIRYPCTWINPEYFEHTRSIGEDAGKLLAVAGELRSLESRANREEHKEYRARKAISGHLRFQTERGAYREEVIEDPPEPGFEEAGMY